jgi:hypothetical protein
MKHYWKIEAMDGFDTTFETLIPGNLTRTEVTTIIQRLACRHLTESEIISASLRKPRRTSLLEPLIGTRPASKRETVSIGHTVNYVASFWREDELTESSSESR